MLDFTDRAFTIATTRNRLLRLVRAHLARGSHPGASVRPRPARSPSAPSPNSASTTATAHHHRRLASTRRGPRSGDRLPDACITQDGQDCWLHEALTAEGFFVARTQGHLSTTS